MAATAAWQQPQSWMMLSRGGGAGSGSAGGGGPRTAMIVTKRGCMGQHVKAELRQTSAHKQSSVHVLDKDGATHGWGNGEVETLWACS